MDQVEINDVEAHARLEKAVAEARQAADEGRVIACDPVRKWLLDLAAGLRSPRPR
jgi:hypothetical protein